jgi:FKBP-type peptidyl-prolyl cis-trans isomerase SlyD
MTIEKDRVVTMEYTLTNDEGAVIDTSENSDPLTYLHGHGMLIPGLEKAIEGKKAQDLVEVSLAPEEGYGNYDEKLVAQVPRDYFEQDDLQPGMVFNLHTEHGDQMLTVMEVGDNEVKVDANHPLAGKKLHFEVSIVEVREASKEELDHGHAH